jgi:hypothetical protein
MNILDCESINSTRQSLSQITRIDSSRIDSFVQSYTESDVPSSDGNPCSAILENFQSLNPNLLFSHCYFFHVTRVFYNEDFKDGILPVTKSIDKIWNCLYDLVKQVINPKDWQILRTTIESECETYKLKLVEDPGPFGFLIREVAFRSTEVGNVDYFRIPEIVEDISACIPRHYNFNLAQLYQERTKPCIVKFSRDCEDRQCLATALYYLYSVRTQESFSNWLSYSFDGHGTMVPKERISKIEFLTNTHEQ